jgi:hypothetical protein
MGTVIWFMRKDDRTAADDDRPSLFREFEFLDELTDGLGVRKLSSFFDYTDARANISEDELDDTWAEEHEAWHEPGQVLTTLEALHARLTDAGATPPGQGTLIKALIDEFRGCIIKAKAAKDDDARVHLCVVM